MVGVRPCHGTVAVPLKECSLSDPLDLIHQSNQEKRTAHRSYQHNKAYIHDTEVI